MKLFHMTIQNQYFYILYYLPCSILQIEIFLSFCRNLTLAISGGERVNFKLVLITCFSEP